MNPHVQARMIAGALELRIDESGRSLASFAREIGVPRSTLMAQLRRGNMPVTTVYNLMTALGLKPWDIAGLMKRRVPDQSANDTPIEHHLWPLSSGARGAHRG